MEDDKYRCGEGDKRYREKALYVYICIKKGCGIVIQLYAVGSSDNLKKLHVCSHVGVFNTGVYFCFCFMLI